MGLLGKIFGKGKNTNNDIEVSQEISLENSQQKLTEIQEKVAEIRKNNERIKQDLRIKEAAVSAIPLAEYHLNELTKYNHTLETAKLPEILSSCENNIKQLLEWFVLQENEYPNATWLLVGGASNMIKKVENRYNEMLLRLAKENFDSYRIKMLEFITEDVKTEHTEIIFSWIDELRGWIDTKAENQQECFNSLNEIHYQVEEIFSNSNSN